MGKEREENGKRRGEKRGEREGEGMKREGGRTGP